MLDSREGVCAGQARFEYPATSALFSILGIALSSTGAYLNTAGVEECFQVSPSDAYVAANLDVGDAVLGDEATHEADLGAQLRSHFFDG